MINQIVNLSQKLREEGIAVSIRSTESAFKAYEDLGSLNRNILKNALRSIYVKDIYDIPKFNKVFEEVFTISEDIPKNENKPSYKTNLKLSKSNKYVIKKGKPNKETIKQDIFADNQIKALSGQPIVREVDDLEREGELLNKDLTKLNKFDPKMLELCQKLGRKIANKRSRRESEARSSKVDMRKTIRANMKYGGIPIELINSKPRNRKNEHVFLNDISGSCEWISSWFFMLVYSAQSAFKKSRTFEFDNKVIETTDALNEETMVNSFIKIRDQRMKNAMIHGTSNMYTAFKSFRKMIDLNNKSYVIILSDCRDWAGPKVEGVQVSVDLVEQMVKDSKKVIILNPEDRNKWDVVDSCVSKYESVGARVFEVNTIDQLAQFIETL